MEADILENDFRPIEGFPGYFVNRVGKVLSIRLKARLLSQNLDKNGYPKVCFSYSGKVRNAFVHSLVAAAFIGPRPKGYHVCHNDGNRANCSASNLRYGTPKENNADKESHGTHPKGEKHVKAKLTELDVQNILNSPEPNRSKLARQFGVSRQHITRILNRERWRHVTN